MKKLKAKLMELQKKGFETITIEHMKYILTLSFLYLLVGICWLLDLPLLIRKKLGFKIASFEEFVYRSKNI